MYLPNRKIHISKYIYMEIDLHILCVSHSLIAWIMHDLRLDDHAWTSSHYLRCSCVTMLCNVTKYLYNAPSM